MIDAPMVVSRDGLRMGEHGEKRSLMPVIVKRGVVGSGTKEKASFIARVK